MIYYYRALKNNGIIWKVDDVYVTEEAGVIFAIASTATETKELLKIQTMGAQRMSRQEIAASRLF